MASHQQLPTKAAPAPRKAPPHVPADRQPEVGIHVVVQQFVTVLRAGRRGGWRAWEFVAVMAMVPPANMPPAQQVADHMSALFPSRATTAVPQAAAVPAQSPPPKAYPRRPAIDVGRPSAVAAASGTTFRDTGRDPHTDEDPASSFLGADTAGRPFFNLAAHGGGVGGGIWNLPPKKLLAATIGNDEAKHLRAGAGGAGGPRDYLTDELFGADGGCL